MVRAENQSSPLPFDGALETLGIFDQRRRLRVVWLLWLVKLIAQAIHFDQLLGVPPPAKRPELEDMTPDELDERVAAFHRWHAQVKKARAAS